MGALGTPEPLIYAIMREESAFQPKAVSSAGARGLMQLMSATAQSVARVRCACPRAKRW